MDTISWASPQEATLNNPLNPGSVEFLEGDTRFVLSYLPSNHFATFPSDLAARCIKAGSPLGGRVLDPFGGSGTTGLAASQEGFNATLIELSPAYIEIAKRRLAS